MFFVFVFNLKNNWFRIWIDRKLKRSLGLGDTCKAACQIDDAVKDLLESYLVGEFQYFV